MTLHTYSLPPLSGMLEDCITLIESDDALLLVGDGVYCAIEGSKSSQILDTITCSLYVLSQDCDISGIRSKIMSQVRVIDYNGFVLLTECHERHVSWD